MTTYVLCNGVTAIQSAPSGGNLPTGSQAANPAGATGQVNVQNQTFQAIVTTTSGNGSATVQPIVSNDGINWVNYGSAITIASAASPAQASGTGASPWQFFSAYVTAISGTGAQVKCLMGA